MVLFQHLDGTRAGTVRLHFSVQAPGSRMASAFTCLTLLSKRRESESYSEWQDADEIVFAPTATILRACIWCEGNGITTIIKENMEVYNVYTICYDHDDVIAFFFRNFVQTKKIDL